MRVNFFRNRTNRGTGLALGQTFPVSIFGRFPIRIKDDQVSLPSWSRERRRPLRGKRRQTSSRAASTRPRPRRWQATRRKSSFWCTLLGDQGSGSLYEKGRRPSKTWTLLGVYHCPPTVIFVRLYLASPEICSWTFRQQKVQIANEPLKTILLTIWLQTLF